MDKDANVERTGPHGGERRRSTLHPKTPRSRGILVQEAAQVRGLWRPWRPSVSQGAGAVGSSVSHCPQDKPCGSEVGSTM